MSFTLAANSGRQRGADQAGQIRSQLVPNTGLRGELRVLLELLSENGFPEVLAVDLAEEEDAISVVRVLVPGLEGLNEHGQLLPGPRAARLRESAA